MKDPFAVPDDEPNPNARQPKVSSDVALNPYAPTLHVSDVDFLESDVEANRRKYLSHEASIKSIGTLHLIPGGLMLVFFVIAVGMTLFTALSGGGNVMLLPGITEVLIVTSVYGGMGGLLIYTGIALRRLKIAGKRLGILVSILGLFVIPIGTLISAYSLYLLLSQQGKVIFSEEYRDVIERTPHIKYQTSLIVKILVVILIAVFSLGVVGMFFGV